MFNLNRLHLWTGILLHLCTIFLVLRVLGVLTLLQLRLR